MANFDQYLQEIAHEINIDPEERDMYYKDYKIVCDYVFHIMCLQDNRFANIFRGGRLFGSYANGIRIYCPNEFDVHMVLRFPFVNQIEELENDDWPGFIHLDFQDVVSHLEFNNDPNNYQHLNNADECKDLVMDLTMNEYSYLDRNKLKSWLNKVLKQALLNYGNTVLGYYNNSYKLSYLWRGITYTLKAKSAVRCFTIDLVPAVEYKRSNQFWYAVPKGVSAHFNDPMSKFTYLIANPVLEQQLLSDGKRKVKIVLQLLQALRNEKDLDDLRCYYLVTVCLWEIKNQPANFWNRPLSVIFVHMLDVLCDYLQDGHLPFYWMPEQNLLENLSKQQLQHYQYVLNKTFCTLSSYMHQPALTFERCASHFAF